MSVVMFIIILYSIGVLIVACIDIKEILDCCKSSSDIRSCTIGDIAKKLHPKVWLLSVVVVIAFVIDIISNITIIKKKRNKYESLDS